MPQDILNAQPKQELDEIIRESHEILFSASTVFPLTLFPDTITIDRSKVNITKRIFFQSADSMSIRVEDLLNISAIVGPILGSVTVTSRVFNEEGQSRTISKFWREDALKLKHIGQGYIIALQKNIDCRPLGTKELVDLLLKLGVDDTPH